MKLTLDITARLIILCLSIFILSNTTLAKSSKLVSQNSILASVDGKVITLMGILPATKMNEIRAAHAYSGKKLEEEIYRIRLAAVDKFIDRQLIIADYRNQNFKIPAKDIEAQIDNIAAQTGANSRKDFVAYLRKNKTTFEEFYKTVEENMAIELMKFRNYKAKDIVTPSDLYKYFKKNENKFSTPSKISLALIMISKKEDIAKIKETIFQELKKSPENFALLAQKYSIGPAANTGGNIGTFEVSNLRKEFAIAIGNKPQKNKIYGPIETSDGFAYLKVLNFNPSTKADFKIALPEIKRLFSIQQRKQAEKEYTERLRSKAVIRYFITSSQF